MILINVDFYHFIDEKIIVTLGEHAMETSKLKTIEGLYDIQLFCKIILPYIMKSVKK